MGSDHSGMSKKRNWQRQTKQLRDKSSRLFLVQGQKHIKLKQCGRACTSGKRRRRFQEEQSQWKRQRPGV